MLGLLHFSFALGLFALGWGSIQDADAFPIVPRKPAPLQSGGSEDWFRSVALDPAGTVRRWEPKLASADWLQVYDVFDAMQRGPEAARWFCEHRKSDLRAGLKHSRSSVRAAAWRIVRMGQGLGADCVDWSIPIDREIGDEAKAWRNAALSESWLDAGERGAAAYRLVLQDLARGGSETHGILPEAYRAIAIHVGVARQETGPSLWIEGHGESKKLRPIHSWLLRPMAHSKAIEELRAQTRETFEEHGFLVEAMALAQAASAGILSGLDASRDWTWLERGLRMPPVESGKLYAWNQVLKELSRLGSGYLTESFWQLGLNADVRLTQETLRILGGLDEARNFYIRRAVESGPVNVLAWARSENRATIEIVWIALEGDWRPIPLASLAPWIRGEHGAEFQVLAVSRLCEAPVSAERRTLLLEVVESCDGEALRLAFRTLAQGSDSQGVQQRLHRIWRAEESDSRQTLLRELPNSSDWEAFGGDWLEQVREPGPCDLLALEHLSYLATDSRWRALFERDFGEALEARFAGWRAGKEPVSRDLARRAAALRRVQTAGDDESETTLSENVLVEGLRRRVDWILGLPADIPAKVRFDFSKACIALIANDPEFTAWVQNNLGAIQKWPRRLRVEVALRLPAASTSDANSALHKFVARVGEEDYARLGEVLKERWLADAHRAGALLMQEATNRRASSNLRQVAMAGLTALGEVDALLQILDEDSGVTGPQLAMESLQPLVDDRIDPALRARWMRARAAAKGDAANQEIEAHLATELLLVLVRRGALEPGETSSILEGPFMGSADQWRERIGGVPASEDWRSQRRIVHQVAVQGQLAALLDQNPGWRALDGRLLVKLAQDARSAGDSESAHLLARWAEVALAGEPDQNQWRDAMGEVQVLRFRLARARGDLANTAWYCDRFVEGMLAGGIPLESLTGGFDVREGRHPLARLSALRLQSLAMLAASNDDADRAQELLGLAKRFCGISTRALDQQDRAADWVRRK
ncbi:MAG: hypothetical protein ACI9X4_000394 [Glaciecola sp.]